MTYRAFTSQVHFCYNANQEAMSPGSPSLGVKYEAHL